jgi:hypothetical protein
MPPVPNGRTAEDFVSELLLSSDPQWTLAMVFLGAACSSWSVTPTQSIRRVTRTPSRADLKGPAHQSDRAS